MIQKIDTATPTIPVEQTKRVRFESQPEVRTIDSIDRQLVENTPSFVWKVFTFLIGIVIFPLGIYWLLTAEEPRPGPSSLKRTLINPSD